MIEVNIQEVRRYLGYQGINKIDEATSRCIEECISELNEKVEPRYIYKFFPINWSSDSDDYLLEFSGIRIGEGKLSKNLEGCTWIAMMAVTLGPVPDMLIRRVSLRETFKAMVYQATGAAMIEAFANDINNKIKEEVAARNLFTRPRFSPGYGDFPLTVQRDFEQILEMPKTIGVSLADSLLMSPTKSITAVVGISPTRLREQDCITSGCDNCNMKNTCDYSLSE